VEITDKQTLSILLTSLYVAKWESGEENPHVVELSGSPYFAKLYNDAVDDMIRLEAGRADAVRNWQRWRTIEDHPDELERTRARIKSIGMWPSWSKEQKRQMVEFLLSPFTATPATLEQLISL
jgi:hypothetical protein